MKFLNRLLENSEIDADIREEVLENYARAKEAFKGLGVSMDEDAEFIFSNHILALLKRIKAHSFVEDIEEDMFSEVSAEAYEKAEQLAAPFFEKEGLAVNRSEVFLVATHIEMALQKEKGGDAA